MLEFTGVPAMPDRMVSFPDKTWLVVKEGKTGWLFFEIPASFRQLKGR